MNIHTYIENLKNANLLVEITNQVQQEYEITNYLRQYNGQAVLFSNIRNSIFPLIGNLASSFNQIKLALCEDNYYSFFQQALQNPKEPLMVDSSPSFNNKNEVNFSILPIPKFFPVDGGRYLTSGIVIAQFPDTHQSNLSIHRVMILDDTRGTIRLVPRDLYNIFSLNAKNGLDTPFVMINGYHPALALAASSPTPFGQSELPIANALLHDTLTVTKSPKYGITIPADVDFIFEGKILANESTAEGPFVDITGTADDIRQQPVVVFEKLYHRDQSIFQTILPAYDEHFILMGFPREVKIHNHISNLVPEVHGVYLSPGGCGWLHAVIAITPAQDGDGKKVGLAALEAHSSVKWCTVVDKDIDIYNNTAVEWATITRAGINDITILDNRRGSSLDPSRNKEDNTSIKVIVDATKKREKQGYDRVIPF